MTAQVSLTATPELLIERNETRSILNFTLNEPPPPEGITVRLNASSLPDFNLSQTETAGGEITLESELIGQLNENLDGTRAGEVPGAAVAIVSPFGSWFGASGVANLEDNTLLQPDDRFEIGSITKTFNATVVLQLVEEGVLSLEDTLTDWLPESITANIPNAEEITIENLLQHTSGIADYVDILFAQAASNPLIFAQDWQPEELVEFVNGIEPFAAPDETFNYSNTNYILSGSIIEAATGNNIAAEIRTRISEPLGLENTFFATEEEIPGGYVSGYWDFDGDGTLNNIDLANLSWTWATGAMVSNTEDLDTFARNLFAGDLLQPDTLEIMLDTIPATDNDNYSSYGLGVGTIESPNRVLMQSLMGETPKTALHRFWYIHRGQTLGYRSNMWYSPQDDLTYIELINGFSTDNIVRDVLPAFREGINDEIFEFTITEQEASISIPVLDDGETEGEETVSFSLETGEGYEIDVDANSAEFTILDNENIVLPPITETELKSIFGSLGEDVIEVSQSSQLIFTGEANDLIDLSTSEGNNRVYAGNGDDTAILGQSNRVFGGDGSDRFLVTTGGDNTLTGGAGADSFWIASAELPETSSVTEVAAEAGYFTFGGEISDSSNRRLLSDKATAIGFEDLDTITFLQFDLEDISLEDIQLGLTEVSLTLEYDSELAENLIPATPDRSVSVSAYEVTAPFDPINSNVDDIDYGEDGANAIATTVVGDDGIYSWDVTKLVRDELLNGESGVNIALSGVFGNENIDDRNSYASFYPVSATDGLEPTLVFETQAVNQITDFTAGEDVIGVAGLGIGFDDLTVTSLEADALIAAAGSNLAILEGVAADSLTESDFAFG